MVIIKVFFYSIVLILSSALGFVFGDIYNKRAKNLLDLQYCIRVLETEIVNGTTPLPIALENVSIKGKGNIANVFLLIRDDLIKNRREDIYDSFLSQRYILQSKYALNIKEVEVFMHLGKVLGKTNKLDQGKNIKFIISQLDNLYTEANMDSLKNTKFYRTLGFLVGLGVVIILV